MITGELIGVAIGVVPILVIVIAELAVIAGGYGLLTYLQWRDGKVGVPFSRPVIQTLTTTSAVEIGTTLQIDVMRPINARVVGCTFNGVNYTWTIEEG